MVQLSHDCFSFEGKMLSLEDAHNLLKQRVSAVVETENISIYDCVGRVLAQDIVAMVNVPSHDNSAVDGYAINYSRIGDNTKEVTLPLVGRIPAGTCGLKFDNSGVVRIFTGAPIPDGFDTVYMQEDVVVDGDNITLPIGQKQGANIRKMGEDIRIGEKTFDKGRRLRPQDIGLLAGQGFDELTVYRKLKVGFFSSGDELIEVGTERSKADGGMLFDSNRPMGLSLIKSMGFTAVDLGRADDNLESTMAILDKGCAECDIIMSAGGMSVGEEDYIQVALKKHNMDFWKVAIKPGKPVGFGVINGTPFMGFPGNPVSVFVVFGLMGILVLRQLSGEIGFELPRLPVKLGFKVKAKLGRREFTRVVLENRDGIIYAMKSGAQGSGVLSSVSASSGFIEVMEMSEEMNIGDTVNYIPFEGLYS